MNQQENGSTRNNAARATAGPRPTSMYPRFSQISDEYRSPPQSPQQWSQATSFDATSEMSIYQSALDLDGSKMSSLNDVMKDSPNNHSNLIRPKSSSPLVDESEVVMEMSRMSEVESAPFKIGKDLYFRDGVRLIDFVLAYKLGEDDDDRFFELRKTFEDNLLKEGLHLENDFEEGRKTNFVKIHAPWEVLITFAEIMKFKMPMKQLEHASHATDWDLCENSIALTREIFPTLSEDEEVEGEVNSSTAPTPIPKEQSFFETCCRPLQFDPSVFPRRAKVLTKEFSRDKMFLFNIPENKDQFFNSASRSRVVDFILKRKRFVNDHNSIFAFGITRLLGDGVYAAAYPLHEQCRYISDGAGEDSWTKLTKEWASLSNIYKLQPLDYIKEYFGVKIGLYFAWLGFYTYMLIPASIVGLLCFIYGIATLNSDIPSNDICNKTLNIFMCPLCDECSYWRLDSSCKEARFIYLVDNTAMVFFALFMSIWGAVFLELWKRYSAVITYEWDLTGFDQSEEHPRPEYLARLSNEKKKRKKNPISNCCYNQNDQMNISVDDLFSTTVEPYISFWKRKLPAILVSISVVLLLVSLAIVAVVGVIFYRMSMKAALSFSYGIDIEAVITINASIVTTATAALINLVCICLLNVLYSKVAYFLTDLEMPRTQTEYDDSLTLKIFLMKFVNYYASIFYIAFFKGKLIGYPGNYDRFFGYRQEECGPGGCLMELAIQLSIIMIGKQTLNGFMEMVPPQIKLWYQKHVSSDAQTPDNSDKKLIPCWERDLFLVDMGCQGLFEEYLEMVLQFGFVTLFVAAFPLAPLFALINNALEMRLDAKKFLYLFRRPVARRVTNIGVWYRIMDCIGKFAVVTNAFIIAFTSTFIPRLVYKYKISPDMSLNGYLNFSLSYFDVNDSEESGSKYNITECRYDDYRYNSSSTEKYDHTTYFWYLLVARLSFVVVYENVVMLLITFLRWLVPDVPRKIQDKIRKDIYLTNEILVNFEAKKNRENDTRHKSAKVKKRCL